MKRFLEIEPEGQMGLTSIGTSFLLLEFLTRSLKVRDVVPRKLRREKCSNPRKRTVVFAHANRLAKPSQWFRSVRMNPSRLEDARALPAHHG